MKVSSILKNINKKQLQEDEGGAATAADGVSASDGSSSDSQDTSGPVNSTCNTGMCNMPLRPLYSPFMGPFIPQIHPVFGMPVYNTVYSQMGEAIRKYRKKKKKHHKK